MQPDFDSNPEYNDKMAHYWPGLYNGDKSLWKNEYNKHGYCYMKRNYLNFIDDYQIYFNKTIEMFEEGYRYLMENIYPDSRGLRNVSKAKFKKMLKNSPMKLDNPSTFCLICNETLNLLTEIYFIFDLNFTRTKQENQQENCPDIFLLNFTDESKLNIWEKYDYYILAVEYCPNICVWKGKECYDILKQKKDYKIGIHGLWPSYTSGVIPKECNIGQDIEVEVDEDKEYYKNYILNHWYSLYNNNTYFLTHEYNKDDPERSVEAAYIKKKVSEHILPQGLRKYDEKYDIPRFGEELVAARILNANALETLDKYPELLDSIDYSQIAIWNRFNEEDIDFNRAISNFINNLVNFNHDPNILLNHYPLLLPTKHIIEVNKFLGDICIDIDSVSKEESSILCVPIEYLKRGYERSDKSDVSVKSLINGINNALYDDGVSNGSKPEVPLRHR